MIRKILNATPHHIQNSISPAPSKQKAARGALRPTPFTDTAPPSISIRARFRTACQKCVRVMLCHGHNRWPTCISAKSQQNTTTTRYYGCSHEDRRKKSSSQMELNNQRKLLRSINARLPCRKCHTRSRPTTATGQPKKISLLNNATQHENASQAGRPLPLRWGNR